ncbi:NAD(P)/FAD-dependent oxidoreductase [Corynebacterium sp. ES2794-CONJ1]|uniref:NAD(P)/FAD-dependent oxidoreductase n=1 Tax=unclassified Corynebacterium TaxID=2624378 RepID=UPI0021672036|nr:MULTISPECIES: NAD(P)/FAD-dependent oxidoreductase [unclassified Corynebacterium]MCS4489366.1 NAD(P)/FAD-dependent oxidoreductase [Corynebacterium sp. ES2775-CONJ]MCS4491179.1 NAD(P)/FAD-dependent oxidoreductase [Corynebacterium sp. ES2715-CONJ3]MCS4530940.1 NAD(P)/FAD-dependent oxidoreductase [Corynebacterium sp. ES2730-CONJ]MCU9518307.1 NAD(P)/FAD-dependent oxidoreductase [Corynebacterium sp. ES2794-CONJ1]
MPETPFRPEGGRHHVVVIGSGFGGLFAVNNLKNADVDITLIDRTNHHLFQPLLYQVATGILSSGEIAPATRQILNEQENVNILKGEVTDIDLQTKTVRTELGGFHKLVSYDSLIVAAGAGQSYFGNDHFAEFAPGMKTLDDALELRARIMGAFERAELSEDLEERDRLLTFVVVGAGPTGVELAGQIAELAHRTLSGAYSRCNPANARIILLDGAPQVLPPFGKRLGRNAQRSLEKIGVTVKLNAIVTDVTSSAVTYKDTVSGESFTIDSYCKIWSAGVAASPLGKLIADQAGVEVDRAGRVPVNSDLTVADEKNVFVIGDMMNYNGLPGVAQVAIQGAEYVADQIAAEVEGRSAEERPEFEYFDKGSMATVSRFNAVVKLGKVEITGFIGWILWLVVHLMFIVGFRNRFISMISWGLNAMSRKRWHLATTRQQMHSRTALQKLMSNVDDYTDAPIEVRDTSRFGRS